MGTLSGRFPSRDGPRRHFPLSVPDNDQAGFSHCVVQIGDFVLHQVADPGKGNKREQWKLTQGLGVNPDTHIAKVCSPLFAIGASPIQV